MRRRRYGIGVSYAPGESESYNGHVDYIIKHPHRRLLPVCSFSSLLNIWNSSTILGELIESRILLAQPYTR